MKKPTEILRHKIGLYDLIIDRWIVYFYVRDLCEIKEYLIRKYYATKLYYDLGGDLL